jgi:hypothetical protein
MLEKASGTTAIGSGTDLFTGNIDLTTTANTLNTATLAASAATRKFKAGDRIGADFGGTVSPIAGAMVEIVLRVAPY